jgi:hypothetical protein
LGKLAGTQRLCFWEYKIQYCQVHCLAHQGRLAVTSTKTSGRWPGPGKPTVEQTLSACTRLDFTDSPPLRTGLLTFKRSGVANTGAQWQKWCKRQFCRQQIDQSLMSLTMASMLILRLARAEASAVRIQQVLESEPEVEDKPGELQSQRR